MKKNSLITQRELATLLGVCPWTIWSWRQKGLLPAPIRIGHTLKWQSSEVTVWLEGQKVSPDFINPIYSNRGVSASASRASTKSAQHKRRGRPTKKEQIEGKR